MNTQESRLVKPGDKVRCIAGVAGISAGQVYTVSKVNCRSADAWFLLEGITSLPCSDGFGVWRFTKVDPKQSEEKPSPALSAGPKKGEEEERAKVIAFFRPKGDQFTCGKCGGSRPCTYHG